MKERLQVEMKKQKKVQQPAGFEPTTFKFSDWQVGAPSKAILSSETKEQKARHSFVCCVVKEAIWCRFILKQHLVVAVAAADDVDDNDPRKVWKVQRGVASSASCFTIQAIEKRQL